MKSTRTVLAEGKAGKTSSAWLRLYVASGTPNSTRAEENLKNALNKLDGQAESLDVQIIDVFKNAKRAMADGVIVTPTLIGQVKMDRMMIMGDLTDSEKLNLMLRSLAGCD